jgi:hypothetical protein
MNRNIRVGQRFLKVANTLPCDAAVLITAVKSFIVWARWGLRGLCKLTLKSRQTKTMLPVIDKQITDRRASAQYYKTLLPVIS